MTSERKIIANRVNARASIGPKTPSGRARSGGNALRHGFNLPLLDDVRWAPEVETLAARVAGEAAERLALAHKIAEARIELMRIRAYRRQMIDTAYGGSRFLAGPEARDFTARARATSTRRETGYGRGLQTKYLSPMSVNTKPLRAMTR